MTRSDRTYTAEKDGYQVIVRPDPNAVSPRDAGFENLETVMIAPERRFERMTSDNPDDMTHLEDMKSRIVEAADCIAQPLYAISGGSKGDGIPFFQLHTRPFLGTKQGILVGFIAATHDEAMTYFKRDGMSEDLYREAQERLSDEIMLMNTYLADEVYRFEVRDDAGEIVAEGKSIYEADLAFDEAMLEVLRAKDQVTHAFRM